MYVFWSDRSSATSSRQSPHPRTSSGSGVIGSGLSSRPHSGQSCRDHPAAADTAVDGVVLSPSISWLVTTIVVLRHWGQVAAR